VTTLTLTPIVPVSPLYPGAATFPGATLYPGVSGTTLTLTPAS
jgi:hypothetical protein